jgi:predicted permease
MHGLFSDVRYGIRALAERPGFTLAAVLTLALGLGANTAVFSFVNAVLLRPLPVPSPDRLVRVFAVGPQRLVDVMSYPNFMDVRSRARVFTALAAHQQVSVAYGTEPDIEVVSAELVSGDFFSVFPVVPVEGRLLTAGDEQPSSSPPVVVTARWLRSRLAGFPTVVGRIIHLNGQPFTIVGVAPERFTGGFGVVTADVWAPITTYVTLRPRDTTLDMRGWGWIHGTGRLRDGVTTAHVTADLEAVAAGLREEHPVQNRGFDLAAAPARAAPPELHATAIWYLSLLMIVVGLTLAASCANLAAALLARSAARRKQVAVKLALGAPRSRIVRQQMVESLLLSGVAAAAGLLIGMWMRDALAGMQPQVGQVGSMQPDLSLDWRTLCFTALLAIVSAACFGAAPAFYAAQAPAIEALRSASSDAGRSSRLQSAFVIAQVAATVVLLAAAGLLLRSVQAARSFDAGFDEARLLVAEIELTRYGYSGPRAQQFLDEALLRVRALPGVERAANALVAPLGGSRESRGVQIDGYTQPDGSRTISIANDVVSPGYFETMGIPILRGRSFRREDAVPDAAPVAVVNETMAQRFWPRGDALGRSVQLAGTPIRMEVVGVARDIAYYALGEPPRPYLYMPAGRTPLSSTTLHVRATGDPAALVSAVRRAIREIDPKVAVYDALAFVELRRSALLPRRILASAATAFGTLTLLLAAAGVYGLTAYAVSRRTREMGVRLALGASPADITRLVVRQTLTVVGVGLLVGSAAAAASGRALESWLVGVTPFDPPTYAALASLMILAALAAAWIPARRAASISPVESLRAE